MPKYIPASLNILLIEDDPEDVELFTQSLEDHKIDHTISLLSDGAKAVEYFKKGESLPDLIVMDLNLPLIHGKESLLHIKKSPLRNIPLVVLTTSSSHSDKNYVLSNGASKFITKPSSMTEINDMVSNILELL